MRFDGMQIRCVVKTDPHNTAFERRTICHEEKEPFPVRAAGRVNFSHLHFSAFKNSGNPFPLINRDRSFKIRFFGFETYGLIRCGKQLMMIKNISEDLPVFKAEQAPRTKKRTGFVDQHSAAGHADRPVHCGIEDAVLAFLDSIRQKSPSGHGDPDIGIGYVFPDLPVSAEQSHTDLFSEHDPGFDRIRVIIRSMSRRQ